MGHTVCCNYFNMMILVYRYHQWYWSLNTIHLRMCAHWKKNESRHDAIFGDTGDTGIFHNGLQCQYWPESNFKRRVHEPNFKHVFENYNWSKMMHNILFSCIATFEIGKMFSCYMYDTIDEKIV